MDLQNLDSAVEAVLFASGGAVSIERLSAVLMVDPLEINDSAKRLEDYYKFERRGIRLIRLENSLQLCSAPEFFETIQIALETRKQPHLTQPSIEVLSVVAYFQPVTRAYIEQVRGVDCGYTIGLLCDRGLIEPSGRLQAPGRPVLYKTTQTFLRTFGLASLDELPPLPEDLQKNTSSDQLKIQSALDEYMSQDVAENSDVSHNV